MTPQSYIADFIKDNIEYLRRKDIEGLYNLLEPYDRKYLTDTLINSGIDPLKFCEKIPKSYASTLPIEEIKFGKKNKVIGSKAFSNCDWLETLIIPEGIELIGVMSFFACSNLTVVHFPKSLKTISKRAFERCDAIEELIYAGTIDEWERLDAQIGFDSYSVGAIPVKCSDGETRL